MIDEFEFSSDLQKCFVKIVNEKIDAKNNWIFQTLMNRGKTKNKPIPLYKQRHALSFYKNYNNVKILCHWDGLYSDLMIIKQNNREIGRKNFHI
jgi:hypothetical protein